MVAREVWAPASADIDSLKKRDERSRFSSKTPSDHDGFDDESEVSVPSFTRKTNTCANAEKYKVDNHTETADLHTCIDQKI